MSVSDETSIVIEQLARGPALVRQVIGEMAPNLRKRRPDPGKWSAHEHAVHLAVVEPVFRERLDYMLSDTAPRIRSYEPSAVEAEGALLALDLEAELARYDRERAEMVARLRALTPDQWAIAAEHDEYARYSVFIMFRHLALHDLHHAYKIEERLLRKSWD